MVKRPVIIDGDWGGDEMQLATVLLAHPESFEIIGATTVFGNTNHDQALRNAGDILHFLHAAHVPFFPGQKRPSGTLPLDSDGAHGDNGLGGTLLSPTPSFPQLTDATGFILTELRKRRRKEVIITATGPLSNIAHAFREAPDTMRRVESILVMGGCTSRIPATDMLSRSGNVTPEAEFNFYMAANDAFTVMESQLPIVLFPMNCTHQLTFTDKRRTSLKAHIENEKAAEAVIQMISAPAQLDFAKFNSAPVMHDVHTALYLICPEQYVGRRGYINVTLEGPAIGHTEFIADINGPVMVMEHIENPDLLFGSFLKSIKRLLDYPLRT